MVKLPRFALIAFTVINLSLCGCSNSKEAELKRGVEFAKHTINDVQRKMVSTLALEDMADQGGTVASFISANVDEKEKYPRFTMDKPTQPWSVVIRALEEEGEYAIEGYGEDLTSPLIREQATLRLMEH